MIRVQPHPEALVRTHAPPSKAEADLCRQLRQALMLLALAQQHCQRLESQLRDVELRERRHRHRAEHDDLTGLLNRLAFRERAQQALVAGRQVAVLMLDLDGFKAINDTLGHAAGDEVLRITAARMLHALRSGDVLGRLGGDEFACLLQNVGEAANVAHLADKLAASIASPMQVAGRRVELRSSLGMAITPEDGGCIDSLLTSADAAMYRAKRDRQAQLAPAPACYEGAQADWPVRTGCR